MKKNRIKYILFTTLLLTISSVILGQTVGINTTNPQALFHIDAKGNNVSAAANKYVDDVVINTSGNLTIGSQIASSTAKVSVAAGSNMMVTDGQAIDVGMSLISDAVGNASWGIIVGASGIFEDRLRIGLSTSAYTLGGGYNNLPNSDFTAKEDGLHFFEIRYYVTVNGVGLLEHNSAVANDFRLIIDNPTATGYPNELTPTILDEYEGYQDVNTTNGQLLGFYTSLSAYLKKDQKVRLQLRVGRGPLPTIKALSSWGANDHLFEVLVKRYNFIP